MSSLVHDHRNHRVYRVLRDRIEVFMKILLTGACGRVGQAIRRVGGGSHQFVSFDLNPKVETISGGIRADVLDRDALLRAAEGCNAIIHTAALHGAFLNKATNQQFIEANVIGSENVFEAAQKHGIRRLVFSSTLEVLCGFDWTASGRTVLDETSPPRPDWIYPLTKLLVEEMGHAYSRQHGLEVVQLRYAWVRHHPIEKIGTGLLARSVHEDDVAEVNLLSATKPGLRDHVFLVGPDTPLDQKDIETAIRDPWSVVERHWPGAAEVLQQREILVKTDDMWPVCRVNSAKQILGWQPKVTFERFLKLSGWSPAASASPRPAVQVASPA